MIFARKISFPDFFFGGGGGGQILPCPPSPTPTAPVHVCHHNDLYDYTAKELYITALALSFAVTSTHLPSPRERTGVVRCWKNPSSSACCHHWRTLTWTAYLCRRDLDLSVGHIIHIHSPTCLALLCSLTRKLFQKQVRKVLWTRKAPACLLTLVYAYGKPRLPAVHNIHHYAPPHIVLQQAAALDARLHALHRHCTSEGSMSSFKSITWNELWQLLIK